MPRRYTTRKLEVFRIQGHFSNDPARRFDYEAFLRAVSQIAPASRIAQINEKTLAIPRLLVADGFARFTAYEGEEGEPLLFNFQQATERIEHLGQGEMLASKTHGLIDIGRREAVVEYNQKGAKASDIGATLEHIANEHVMAMRNAELDITPVINQQFINELNRFRRIRLATIKVARPNQDWTDHVEHIDQMGEESAARYIEVTMTAQRMQSLAERTGIIGYIRRIAQRVNPTIKTAKVTGVREGEAAETTVSLSHHIEHQRVQVRMTEDGHVDDADIERRIEGFLRARAEQAR